jgi:hypothetical protein
VHYGDDLANTVKNMILISEVANLGKEIEKHGDRVFQRKKLDLNESREVFNDFFGSSHSVGDVDKKLSVIDDTTLSSMIGNERVIDEEKRNKLTGTLDHSQKIRLEELLGKWEEPETVTEVEVSCVPCNCPADQKDILTFILFFANRRTYQSLQFYSFDRCSHTWTKITPLLLLTALLTEGKLA